MDCLDGSDEIDCNYKHFYCENGKIISHQFICDFIFDCEDKSDEKFCSYKDIQQNTIPE